MNAAPLLEAENLTRYYRVRRGPFVGKATLKALDGVSFTLDSRDNDVRPKPLNWWVEEDK